MGASEALASLARMHAEDNEYESPFAVEYARELGLDKKTCIEEMFMGRASPRGGKMDDITVVVGMIVATAESTIELVQAEAASQQLVKSLEVQREMAREEEAETERIVEKRRGEIIANDAKTAAKDELRDPVPTADIVKSRYEAPEYLTEPNEMLNNHQVRDLLVELDLPISGKLPKLKESIGQVKMRPR